MLISNGHSYNAVRNKYTISQVYLFAEKIKKIELDKDRMNAIVMSNCLLFSSPANDMAEARKKSNGFQQFLEGLTWENLIDAENEKSKPRKSCNINRL